MEKPQILKIDTLEDNWSDKDRVMLHACFQLLSNCVEQENLLDGDIDWNHTEATKAAQKEIQLLYDWWQKRKSIDKQNAIDLVLDKKQYEEDDAMLIRLIKIRRYLWT